MTVDCSFKLNLISLVIHYNITMYGSKKRKDICTRYCPDFCDSPADCFLRPYFGEVPNTAIPSPQTVNGITSLDLQERGSSPSAAIEDISSLHKVLRQNLQSRDQFVLRVLFLTLHADLFLTLHAETNTSDLSTVDSRKVSISFLKFSLFAEFEM